MELLIPSTKKRHASRILSAAGYHSGVVLICIPFVFVFLWMALGALKTQVQNTGLSARMVFYTNPGELP